MFTTANANLTHLVAESVHKFAQPLTGAAEDYDALLALIGDARFVLIGDASHGTHEFYRERAHLTQRLIEEKGFNAVAVEADWPDAYRVNRYVRDLSENGGSRAALAGFRRFPQWMWRNADVLDFVDWLRAHNDQVLQNAGASRPTAQVGFYGLDLYSWEASMEAVLNYLDRVDPEAARRARYRYGCFEDFGEDPQTYGYVAGFNLDKSCEREVIHQLQEMQQQAVRYLQQDGHRAADEQFYAEQNARLVKNAEAYYRTMFRSHIASWNLRDQHMAETLEALVAHLDQEFGRSKVVIWAHNSHLGDARATQMGAQGELNVGQLMRARYGAQAVLIGFSTYTGTVTAASDWNRPAQKRRVRPALPESYEAVFHQVNYPRFWLQLRPDGEAVAGLPAPRLERAIGVIYRPETERASHYFWARLPQQFDALLHFDETQAVEPLERTPEWEQDEIPETFPTGI
jgi:erythromycin esterase-like protein